MSSLPTWHRPNQENSRWLHFYLIIFSLWLDIGLKQLGGGIFRTFLRLPACLHFRRKTGVSIAWRPPIHLYSVGTSLTLDCGCFRIRIKQRQGFFHISVLPKSLKRLHGGPGAVGSPESSTLAQKIVLVSFHFWLCSVKFPLFRREVHTLRF